MKGLFKYLSPFAPDQSGAVSVLYEFGGIIVICDAGGCTGNTCGFDEPRWIDSKSALFSAGLRDLDAIFGGDDRLLDKIADAVSQIDCNFIALIGTPVPAVIGTDFRALARIAEKRFGIPVITVDTNGMDLYDRGQEKAYLGLFRAFASAGGGDAPEIGIIGATPLDLLNSQNGSHLISQLKNCGYDRIACYGMGAGLASVKKSGAARCNLVVSPSGLNAAQWLRERFGTPYVAGIPLTDLSAKELSAKIDLAVTGTEPIKPEITSGSRQGGMLIIHQQILANSIRNYLRTNNNYGNIDVASWFMLDKELAESGDSGLHEEDDLLELVTKRQYKVVAGDPLFKRALPGWNGGYVDFPHFAVSGGLFGNWDAEKFLRQLNSCVTDNSL